MNTVSKAISMLMLITISCTGLDQVAINEPSKVVIDGYIEEGQYPIVYLTYSSGFYDPVDSTSLQELVLTTARVEVSDGINSEVLTLFRNSDIFPPFYYRGTDLRGEAGKAYTLEVISKGGTYTATTTIPPSIPIDSAWFEQDDNDVSLGELWMEINDDPDRKNYYRTFIKVRGEHDRYYPTYHSTLEDRNFDGETFQFPLYQSPNSTLAINQDILFHNQDTVTIRLCTMDREHFDFWRTLEQELYLIGNPFGSAGNEIKSNIKGDKPVLGVWGGYGAAYKTVVLN